MSREAASALEDPGADPMGTEELQKLHYDRIGTEYESHYGDRCSRQYRGEFVTAFSFDRERYPGNEAYLLVLNSMVFRIPVRLKPLYTPIVMAGEPFINKFVGKWSSCFVVCQWQKI